MIFELLTFYRAMSVLNRLSAVSNLEQTLHIRVAAIRSVYTYRQTLVDICND